MRRPTVTRSETSDSSGPNGTTSTAAPFASSGTADPASGRSRRASPVPRTSLLAAAVAPGRRSTSSQRTTGSPPPIWSRTTTSTTKPTVKTIVTAPITTIRSTTESKARAPIPRFRTPGHVMYGRYWPRSCCRQAHRCSPPETSSATVSAETTTRIVFPHLPPQPIRGPWTGRRPISRWCSSSPERSDYAERHRRCVSPNSSKAEEDWSTRTSSGSTLPASSSTTPHGTTRVTERCRPGSTEPTFGLTLEPGAHSVTTVGS